MIGEALLRRENPWVTKRFFRVLQLNVPNFIIVQKQ